MPDRNCSNCCKPFPEDKLDLHEIYCQRNIKPCPKCKAMVDVHFLEDHNKQTHALVGCRHCSMEFEPLQLKQHEDKCKSKQIVCQYCQLPVVKQDFQNHTRMCGSRSKPCDVCGKNIILQNFQTHLFSCMAGLEERWEQPVSRPAPMPRPAPPPGHDFGVDEQLLGMLSEQDLQLQRVLQQSKMSQTDIELMRAIQLSKEEENKRKKRW